MGFTIPFRQQLLPALTMAAAVRREVPAAKIVFGGHLITQQLGDPQRMADLFDLVDFAVVHDGEESLSSLCRQLEKGSDPATAGNLLWRDPQGTVRQSPTTGPLSPADLPAPDFQGLDVGRLSQRHGDLPPGDQPGLLLEPLHLLQLSPGRGRRLAALPPGPGGGKPGRPRFHATVRPR